MTRIAISVMESLVSIRSVSMKEGLLFFFIVVSFSVVLDTLRTHLATSDRICRTAVLGTWRSLSLVTIPGGSVAAK